MTVYVYWIHFLEHTDPYTEGYIGISKNPTKRFSYHCNKNSSDNYFLYESLKKGAIQSIIHECESREEALKLESQYRPAENIGWNIISGGGITPDQTGKRFGPKHGMYGKKHKPESNQKRSQSLKGLKWWNNGVINVKSKDCPAGFKNGKITFTKYTIRNKGNIGKSGKAIITPHGKFNTISEAARNLNMSWDKVSYRIHNDKFVDWHFIN